MNKKGFTLLELLVVVLIIGILASIALPQFRKSLEKARLSEALINFKVIEGAIDRYILANGFPSEEVYLEDLDIDLSDGNWSEDNSYVTRDFEYWVECKSFCEFEIYNNNELYGLTSLKRSNSTTHICHTYDTDIGEYICHYLESQGWEYEEGEI